MTPKPKASTASSRGKKEVLYEKCLEQCEDNHERVFQQQELLDMGVAKDLKELLALCNELGKKHLIQTFVQPGRSGAVCFRIRSRDVAKTLCTLSQEDISIYKVVAESGTTGVWTRYLSQRTGLHATIVQKSVKHLEQKNLIKRRLSLKTAGSRISYILFDLEPPEDVTGGSWYKDGELDTSFVKDIGNVIVGWMQVNTWREAGKVRAPPRNARRADKGSGKNAGQEARKAGDGEEADAAHPVRAPIHNGRYLVPYPAGYEEYPTASEVWHWLEKTELVSDRHIQVKDIQHLIDMLVFDGRLEAVGKRRPIPADPDSNDEDEDVEDEEMYRWRPRLDVERDVEERELGLSSGFAETLCARCPAFKLCEEGGPVDASSCGYFEKWLDK